jgi:hypothetical protein
MVVRPPVRALLVVGAVFAAACSDVTAPSKPAESRPIVFIGRVEWPGRVIGNPAIYSVRDDGSDLRLLTYGAGQALYPAWSRDGSQIAFVSGTDGGADLWLMSADGTNPHRASTRFPVCVYSWTSLSWASDGQRIAGDCFWNVLVFDLKADTARSVTDPLQATLIDPIGRLREIGLPLVTRSRRISRECRWMARSGYHFSRMRWTHPGRPTGTVSPTWQASVYQRASSSPMPTARGERV